MQPSDHEDRRFIPRERSLWQERPKGLSWRLDLRPVGDRKIRHPSFAWLFMGFRVDRTSGWGLKRQNRSGGFSPSREQFFFLCIFFGLSVDLFCICYCFFLSSCLGDRPSVCTCLSVCLSACLPVYLLLLSLSSYLSISYFSALYLSLCLLPYPLPLPRLFLLHLPSLPDVLLLQNGCTGLQDSVSTITNVYDGLEGVRGRLHVRFCYASRPQLGIMDV